MLSDRELNIASAMFSFVQRLFSMFPTGGAGVGLVVLRSVVGLTVIVDMSAHWTFGCPAIIDGFVTLVGLSLLLGFLTPYCVAISCLLELMLLVLMGAPVEFQRAMSILTAVSAAMLGPGAYSLDGRIFGRKSISIPPQRNSQ
jgi:hypothetical protein